MSGERLQGHWTSGFKLWLSFFLVFNPYKHGATFKDVYMQTLQTVKCGFRLFSRLSCFTGFKIK